MVTIHIDYKFLNITSCNHGYNAPGLIDTEEQENLCCVCNPPHDHVQQQVCIQAIYSGTRKVCVYNKIISALSYLKYNVYIAKQCKPALRLKVYQSYKNLLYKT
jgi:hypothetical protein